MVPRQLGESWSIFASASARRCLLGVTTSSESKTSQDPISTTIRISAFMHQKRKALHNAVRGVALERLARFSPLASIIRRQASPTSANITTSSRWRELSFEQVMSPQR